MASFRETLSLFKTRIDAEIGQYFDRVIEKTEKEDKVITDALSYVRQTILSGGKRIRPSLMYYGYLSAGGSDREKMFPVCVSIELVHTFLLMHDDIIDRDDMRHGIHTVHSHYAKKGRRLFSRTDADHFGLSMGLIVGDMIAALGNQIIFNAPFPPRRILHALDKLQSIVSYTVVGEVEDIYIEYRKRATDEEILRMYTNKTAKYTIEGPLHLGAILAGADQPLLDSLSAFSTPLGIAFQIQDDSIGIFGAEKKIGKPVGSDIREGKVTLLVNAALRRANSGQKQRINQLLGDEFVGAREISEFQTLMMDTGAFAEVTELARANIEEAKRVIEACQMSVEAKDFLLGMADYMMVREI